MRDIHCHILPGVDDGSRSMRESLAMLEAAINVGVTSITCTPHCREPYFDFDKMWAAYQDFKAKAHVAHPGFPIRMGFEVNHRTLRHIGFEWADRLGFEGSDEFLLELSTNATHSTFDDYARTIFKLQSMGYTVIVAHPERYRAIQDDLDVAKDLVHMGCKLQASADFIAGGRLGREKKPAKRLFKEGLYTYIASDAHCVEHYDYLRRACKKFPLESTRG